MANFIETCFAYVRERYGGEQKLKEKRAVLVFESTVNGYHYFRIRPLVGTEMPMFLQQEENNSYDENAILVRIPSKTFFPDLNKEKETKDGQSVADVLGKVVGRLPRNVAEVIKAAITSEEMTHSFVFYTGNIVHGGQRAGGGVKLHCVFVTFIKHASVQDIKTRLEEIGLDVASLYA